MIDAGPDGPGSIVTPTSASAVRDDPIPLVRRFPALAAIPRARLGKFPTPVEHLTGFRDVDQLYVKHEDRSSDVLGGNAILDDLRRSMDEVLRRRAPSIVITS